jgi:hypothetical protein
MKKIISAVAVAASLFAVNAQAADVVGASSVTFTHPAQLDSNAVYSGVNTNSFTWGDASVSNVGQNNLTFVGNNFSSSFNTAFKLGTITYFNGTTALNSNLKQIDLTSRLAFSQPAGLPAVNSSFTLGLNSTPNTSDPVASADFVNFNNTTSSSRFVINGNTYTVKITGFQNVVGDGFLQSSATEFHVMEGKRASADLYGSVVLAAPVPEPETYAMMLAGLGMLGFFARRRKAAKV